MKLAAAAATTDTDFIKFMFVENARDITNISRKTIDNHMTKMRYVNRCEVWIPQLLTETDFINCDFLL